MRKIRFDTDKRNVISQSLKRIRKKQKLTQTDLAARMQTMGVNIDQQMISKIERDCRIVTDYELACFCRALKVAPEELFEDFYREYTQKA